MDHKAESKLRIFHLTGCTREMTCQMPWLSSFIITSVILGGNIHSLLESSQPLNHSYLYDSGKFQPAAEKKKWICSYISVRPMRSAKRQALDSKWSVESTVGKRREITTLPVAVGRHFTLPSTFSPAPPRVRATVLSLACHSGRLSTFHRVFSPPCLTLTRTLVHRA